MVWRFQCQNRNGSKQIEIDQNDWNRSK
jgi:hypothetical protein